MKSLDKPLVSIVTPVHNGEKYLRECIESVLNQKYKNWEYIIVDNLSRDNTLQIIKNYSKEERRIKLYQTNRLLPVMKNFNYALSLISPQSIYCKMLHADDWMFPQCIDEMVRIAERYKTVGIVGSYCLWNEKVKCDGLAFPTLVAGGRQIGKMTLMGKIFPFLSPSCLLIRSDLIRNRTKFYNDEYLHGDVEAMYDLLQQCDFGFVHQVLTFIRDHESSMTSTHARPINEHLWSNFNLFLKYSNFYLNDEEIKARKEQMLNEYYEFLARNVFIRRENEIWLFHKERLKKINFDINLRLLLVAVLKNYLKKKTEQMKSFFFNHIRISES
jgi:glycosyltransferase involved in cell wall biosynthesis